jgi:DNA polymerase III subunit epsilon
MKNIALLRSRIDQAPQRSGVYTFYNQNNYPLYIGKSINLQKRLLSHFYAIKTNPAEAKLFQQTQTIAWKTTPGELGALLLEAAQIKQYLPLYNKRLRRQRGLLTLCLVEQGYAKVDILPFNIERAKSSQVYGLFKSRFQAQQCLRDLVKTHQLCDFTLTGFPTRREPCFSYQLKSCCGPCAQQLEVCHYNQRVKHALSPLSYLTWPYPGRIAIRETSDWGEVQYHLIDNWVYLQTKREPTFEPLPENDALSFDRDYYLTLVRFLRGIPADDVIVL